jgi:hypothetical protein
MGIQQTVLVSYVSIFYVSNFLQLSDAVSDAGSCQSRIWRILSRIESSVESCLFSSRDETTDKVSVYRAVHLFTMSLHHLFTLERGEVQSMCIVPSIVPADIFPDSTKP